jgi:hypothetical protein
MLGLLNGFATQEIEFQKIFESKVDPRCSVSVRYLSQTEAGQIQRFSKSLPFLKVLKDEANARAAVFTSKPIGFGRFFGSLLRSGSTA